jgi:hypothetical protein
MGMFDYFNFVSGILPEEYDEVDWQTKSLQNIMATYIVDEDKTLRLRNVHYDTFDLLDDHIDVTYDKVDFTGRIYIHGYKNFLDWEFGHTGDRTFYRLIINFNHGVMTFWSVEEWL